MIKQHVTLENRERFLKEHIISKEKLIKAVEKATDKLEERITLYKDKLPLNRCGFKYEMSNENNNWVCGLYTGTFWLAYELTGNKKFKEIAKMQLSSYRERFNKKENLDDHDVGFVYTPSCVAAYKVTGDEKARELALDAAKFFYDFSYSEKGGFVLRYAGEHNLDGSRTMMDTLMNVPLLFWAGEELGDEKYTKAGHSQSLITEKYLLRSDASSFHHYQFAPDTLEPIGGLTLQGFSDSSCWSRGHSWGIYGFPIAYSYTKDSKLIDYHKDVTYYMLNHLPCDNIPYWDFIFTNGDEPRDSSAGVIGICGMNEMCRHLPDDAEQKMIFKNASSMMLESIIDLCTGDVGEEYDGLIAKVSGAVTLNSGIEKCAPYGDYFYLEALLRFLKPDWKKYW